VKQGLEIVPVSTVEEVLAHALVRVPTPVTWEEPVEPPKTWAGKDGPDEAIATH